VSWQPPEEEGDDDPILGDGPPTPRRVFPAPRPPRAESTRPDASAAALPKPGHELPPGTALPPAGAIVDPETGAMARPVDGDWIELYVSVGRREGARALDLQRVLVESGGVDKANVRRVRVRDRNAFVSVLRADVDRSLAALNGATIGSKTATAEIARSSSDAVDAPKSGPAEDESRRP
jgi:ATP-dependent RNA helicase DeaD